jgi:selenocysteine-specific elongation factor
VIAVSKTDLVTPDQAERVADDALRLLRRSGLEPLPPVMTSVSQKHGIESLARTLAALAATLDSHSADGLAYMPIDRAFSIAGHGPVVTGTLRAAAVSTGDTLELLPMSRTVRVRAVQVHRAPIATAAPGQRVALNLRDIDIGDLKRGMALAAPGSLQLSDWLTVSIRAVQGAPPLRNGTRLRAMLGTGVHDVRLRLLDSEVLEAGASGFAQLRCAEAVAIPVGEHAILRLASAPRTVAGGKVLETGARRAQRMSPRVLQRLGDLLALPPAAMIAAEVRRAGSAGTTLQHLSLLSALATPRVVELLRTAPVVITQSGWVVLKSILDRLLEQIPSLLASHADGLTHDKLLSVLSGSSVALLDEALERLLAHRAISKHGSQYRIPRPAEDRIRARNEAALLSRIAETLRRGGLSPPAPNVIVTDSGSHRAVERLLGEGVVVRAIDRAKGREILFHREAIDEAQRRLAPLLERGRGLLVTEVGAALGISRKYSMPLLEHLDTIQFTCRIKDRRIRGSSPAVR